MKALKNSGEQDSYTTRNEFIELIENNINTWLWNEISKEITRTILLIKMNVDVGVFYKS